MINVSEEKINETESDGETEEEWEIWRNKMMEGP